MTSQPTRRPRPEEGEKDDAPAPVEEVRVPPPSTCIETINGERPIRLSFQIKVF